MGEKSLIESRINELRGLIEYYSDMYYNQDSPVIEDSDYDRLFYELVKLEKENPEFDSPDSPTHKVGGKAAGKFSKVSHEVPMGSLTDVFSYEELGEFLDRTSRVGGYTVESKIDGLSVSLVYDGGKLVQGSTRGDGLVGEDITENVKTIADIPQRIEYDGHLEVRGEVYMPREVFRSLNAAREEEGQRPFANPRNAAAGSLRQLDARVTAERKLSIFIFNVQKCDRAFTLHSESLNFLKNLGFTTVPIMDTVKSRDDVIASIEKIGAARESLPFDIDGAVIKVDSLKERETIGFTSNTPKWAVAYKYPPERAESLLKDIVIQVGRTGVLTPNALFEPVRLAGTSVRRATLHNIEFIRERDIRPGDTVIVQKAGDIIPEIIGVNLSKRPDNCPEYEMPSKCPSCGEAVYREEGEVAYRCTNVSCPAQLSRNIVHFSSRDAMDIDGLGPAVVDALISGGLIKDAADLYGVDSDSLCGLERFGRKSADNLVGAIEKSKTRGLSRVLYALGIRQIGEKAAKDLAREFGDIETFFGLTVEDLIKVDDIGQTTAENVVNFFSHPQTRELVDRLLSFGVVMKEEKKEKTGSSLDGMVFVITGTLPTLSRKEAEELIEENGGKVTSSVSKKTTMLLVGADAGSKLDKAAKLGVPTVSEEELRKMIG